VVNRAIRAEKDEISSTRGTETRTGDDISDSGPELTSDGPACDSCRLCKEWKTTEYDTRASELGSGGVRTSEKEFDEQNPEDTMYNDKASGEDLSKRRVDNMEDDEANSIEMDSDDGSNTLFVTSDAEPSKEPPD
jgi:hypothetical protein